MAVVAAEVVPVEVVIVGWWWCGGDRPWGRCTSSNVTVSALKSETLKLRARNDTYSSLQDLAGNGGAVGLM